jgi:hypothetical protein
LTTCSLNGRTLEAVDGHSALWRLRQLIRPIKATEKHIAQRVYGVNG